jgi:hypothetical protein
VTDHTVPLSALVGRVVRDDAGRKIGRIQELTAEIVSRRDGNDYVVTHVTIGRYGRLDDVMSAQLMSCAGERWRRWAGYRRYEIPWQRLDLRDPMHPRLRRASDAA